MYAVLRYQAPRKAEEIREEARERIQAEQRHELYVEMRAQWESWFDKVNLSGVEVEDVTETRAGYTLHLAAGPNEEGKMPRFSQLHAALEDLAVITSRYYKKQGITIAPDQVRAEETEAAHEWLLHVDTRQPLKASIPYPGDTGAGSIVDPLQLGLYQDGSPMAITLCGVHGLLVGATGSGKSVCLNCLLAALTRCPDVEVWVGATSKLMPLVWPWLACWLTGKTARPVIERIAGEGLDEVLLMLADLYKLGKLRNRRLGPLWASEFTAAIERARKHLAHWGVQPATGDRVPVSNFPVYAKADLFAAWEPAKARFLAEQVEYKREQDPVLNAMDGRRDDEWIRVSDLGKLVGRVVDGDVREQARQFSAQLREKYGLASETAFQTH